MAGKTPVGSFSPEFVPDLALALTRKQYLEIMEHRDRPMNDPVKRRTKGFSEAIMQAQ